MGGAVRLLMSSVLNRGVVTGVMGLMDDGDSRIIRSRKAR